MAGTFVTLTGSGTWTVPATASQIAVYIWGAGGGGGGGFSGGGGGAFQYLTSRVVVTAGASISYNCGTGGTGGIGGSSIYNPGSNGTATTFGTSGQAWYLSADFGRGAGGGSSAPGGAGGVATSGAGFNGINGTAGNAAQTVSGSTYGDGGGTASATDIVDGTIIQTGATASKQFNGGTIGRMPGGGGSAGGFNNSSGSAYSGGNGAAGSILIVWYASTYNPAQMMGWF